MLTNATCSNTKLNNHKSLFTVQVGRQLTECSEKNKTTFFFHLHHKHEQARNDELLCKSGFSFSSVSPPTEKIVGIVINGAEAN